MANCKQCGKKISMFEVSSNGLCSECIKLSNPAAVQKMQMEEALRQNVAMREEAHREELQQMYESGNLPPLQCLNPETLEIRGGNLVFVHKKKNESVPIQNIASLILKKPSFGTNGTITVQLQKGNDAFVGVGNIGIGLGSELVAIFKKEQWELAQLYEKYINNYSARTVQTQNSVPTVNDLRALKQLVDEGVLTEEEFTAKKRQLLGI